MVEINLRIRMKDGKIIETKINDDIYLFTKKVFMKEERIELEVGGETIVVNLKEMSSVVFRDLVDPSEFTFEIIKSGSGSELEKECNELANQMLVDTDGKGILSDNAIEHSDRIVAVTDPEKSVLAFCAISFLVGNNKVLDDNALDYLNRKNDRKNAVYIEQIVVSDDYKRQGIATQLIEYVQSEFGAKYIYSHVSVNNIPSTFLHLKSGFRAVNWYHSDNFFGIENYNSIFFKKNTKEGKENEILQI